jgi:hypothetical protein
MQFDPKLIRPDEPPLAPDGEMQLPDDLSALAEQLGDDAAHLASCYPPPPRTIDYPTPSTALWRKRMAATAMMLSGSALVAVLAATIFLRQSARPVTSQAYQPEQPPQSSFTSKSIDPHTTISLADLSGPELEALLDLMEHEHQATISVSF